jgi:FkbM family methyltransferase
VVEFAAVGASGAVVDLSVTLSLLGRTHYLVANAAGFLLAVTWNFGGNWWLVFDRPDGSLAHQYASYVGLHGVTFGVRAAVLALLIDGVGVPATPATVAGIGAAAIANYLGTERILEDGLEWFDAAAALNSLAHAVYGSRVRRGLRRVGVYGYLYRGYAWLLAGLYREDRVTVAVGDVEVTLPTEQPAEIVSVLHTLEKERPVLEAFAAAVDEETVVWDVGANLGVYGAVAAAAGATVVAVEPVHATAARCATTLRENGAQVLIVIPAALAADSGRANLGLERREVGTQTPTIADGVIDARHERSVRTVAGDDLLGEVPAPDILKIDVEGAEAAVLDGCGRVLQAARRVFVEVHGDPAPIQERLLAAGAAVGTITHAESGQAYLDARWEP